MSTRKAQTIIKLCLTEIKFLACGCLPNFSTKSMCNMASQYFNHSICQCRKLFLNLQNWKLHLYLSTENSCRYTPANIHIHTTTSCRCKIKITEASRRIYATSKITAITDCVNRTTDNWFRTLGLSCSEWIRIYNTTVARVYCVRFISSEQHMF